MSDKDKPVRTGSINTGGGAYIGGKLNVGGDFAGRDQFKVVSTQGATMEEFLRLWRELQQLLPEAGLAERTGRIINGDLEVIQAELKETKPDRSVVQTKLDSIVKMLSSAGGAAGAAEGLLAKIVALGGRLSGLAAALF